MSEADRSLVAERLNTISQFLDHLAYDAIPPLVDRPSSQKGDPVKEMPLPDSLSTRQIACQAD
jgi:hypothetical protein